MQVWGNIMGEGRREWIVLGAAPLCLMISFGLRFQSVMELDFGFGLCRPPPICSLRYVAWSCDILFEIDDW
jgi:hypothetical protein